MKPLLVGEANPYSRDPSHALYPLPRQASGNRLRTILGMSDELYLETFDRCNLCVGHKWSLKLARIVATKHLAEREVLILLGAKVCSAFDLAFTPFEVVRVAKTTCAILPHPSGLSRAWNNPTAIKRARAAVREVLK